VGEEGGCAARRVFVAPWLITLHDGTMWVPIWPDALLPGAFRRLLACARWIGDEAPKRHTGATTRPLDDDAQP
jgi:hypothetical protein